MMSDNRILGKVKLVSGHLVNFAFDQHKPIARQLEPAGKEWVWAKVFMGGSLFTVWNGAAR